MRNANEPLLQPVIGVTVVEDATELTVVGASMPSVACIDETTTPAEVHRITSCKQSTMVCAMGGPIEDINYFAHV